VNQACVIQQEQPPLKGGWKEIRLKTGKHVAPYRSLFLFSQLSLSPTGGLTSPGGWAEAGFPPVIRAQDSLVAVRMF
jgi:hypothetical protein